MDCYLQEHLKQYFSPSEPLFDQLMALQGECFRDQKGRLTQRLVIGDQSYFIKQHKGVGWREILKNVVQWRLPIISAKNEWRAIQKLQSLNIATPKVVGFGQRGYNPAKRQSFVLMEELAPTVSLETVCQTWKTSPPSFKFKRHLIAEVAHIARILHQNGINHRDFYLCHFLLDTSKVFTLYLIDLHRAHIHRSLAERWIIKDIAGLYFSSKAIGLTQRDLYRFMKYYRYQPLRNILTSEKNFWQKVKVRGEQLYCDHRTE